MKLQMLLKRALVFMAAVIGICCTAEAKKAESTLPDTYAFNRGVELYQNDQYEEALSWFKKELAEHPDNGYAHLYISAILLEDKDLGRALTSINEAIKKLPKKDKKYTAVAYANRADVYAALEDTVKALADYSTAIKLEPTNNDILNRRANIYYEQDKYDLADADYNKMIENDEGDVMGYMGIGRNANEQKNWDEALKNFTYVIKLAPNYSSGYSFRADTYIGMEKWDEAIDDVIKALEMVDYRAWLTVMTFPDEQHPLLITKLNIQAAKDRNNSLWPFIKGAILQFDDDFKGAIAAYEAANKIDASAMYYNAISDCYAECGKFNEALDAIDKAISLNPKKDDYLKDRGGILCELGDYEGAIVDYDKYALTNPDDPNLYYYRGWTKKEAKDYKGALEDLTTAIMLKPEYVYSYLVRADINMHLGENDLAMADYKKVVELDTVPNPDNDCAHYAYFYLGQKDKAIEFMDSVIAVSTSKSDLRGSYYDAACLYSLMGETEKSLDYLRKSLELGFRRFAHISVDSDLDNIRELPEFKALIEEFSTCDDESESATGPSKSSEKTTTEVPFSKEGGVTKVKCTINDLPLYFIFDTGAASVSLSLVEANFMYKNDYINRSDIIGSDYFLDANGDITEDTIINLRKVDFGGLELENVRASVVRNQKAPLLLGQSVLGRLGKIEIDNENQVIRITN